MLIQHLQPTKQREHLPGTPFPAETVPGGYPVIYLPTFLSTSGRAQTVADLTATAIKVLPASPLIGEPPRYVSPYGIQANKILTRPSGSTSMLTHAQRHNQARSGPMWATTG